MHLPLLSKPPIYYARIEAEKTQRQVATAINVSVETVCRWENRRLKVSDLNRYKLAKFFEKLESDLFPGEDHVPCNIPPPEGSKICE
jgi:DNA-binding XRE family transcriptional regulator